ncbi:MAG: ATP-binding cassette domain-containing protein [Planctomycetota bacterium]|nr:ATP-binding cassette domain-containing protein [Planctomycetota bacterium]
MPDAISIRGVTKTFGNKYAVRDLDLVIPERSLCGLIGPNGAGKTTTIRMVMSIIFPDKGEIAVLGKKSAVESKDRIGYLPEERGLYRKMKVGAFLHYVGRLKGVDDAGLQVRVKEWLDRVGLGDTIKKKCEELSKGMQQKVQVLASIIHQPDLIILDEPFSGLDPVNAKMLRELIDEQHQRGATIIFSTHQMYQAETLCDRVVMIHQGKKVIDNTPQEIRERHDPRTVLVTPALGPHADVERAIRGVEGVDSLESINGSYLARAGEGDSPAAVLARIAARVPVTRIELVRPTLEDVFIDIVEGDAPQEEREQLRAALAADKARGDRGGD